MLGDRSPRDDVTAPEDPIADLESLIARGEGDHLEFKRSLPEGKRNEAGVAAATRTPSILCTPLTKASGNIRIYQPLATDDVGRIS
jgi:hypothetical protein